MCMWERNEGLDECLARAGFLVGDDGCADRIRKFTALSSKISHFDP